MAVTFNPLDPHVCETLVENVIYSLRSTGWEIEEEKLVAFYTDAFGKCEGLKVDKKFEIPNNLDGAVKLFAEKLGLTNFHFIPRGTGIQAKPDDPAAKKVRDKLVDASLASQFGDMDGMERHIAAARAYAASSGTVIDEPWIERMRKDGSGVAALSSLKEALREAEYHARLGDMDNVEKFIAVAIAVAAGAGLPIEQGNLERIRKYGKTTKVRERLREADLKAEVGKLEEMKKAIAEARNLAASAGVEVAEDVVNEISAKGHERAAQEALDNANMWAKRGYAPGMDRAIEDAIVFAVNAGTEIDVATVNAIKKVGYTKALEVELRYADGAAGNGNVKAMEDDIATAMNYAAIVGIKIDEASIKGMRQKGYNNAVRNALENARYWAQQEGGLDTMELSILTAYGYADKAPEKIVLDKSEIDEIRGLAVKIKTLPPADIE